MPTKVYSTKSSLNSKKSRVALALAVFLWIGGRAVCSCGVGGYRDRADDSGYRCKCT